MQFNRCWCEQPIIVQCR